MNHAKKRQRIGRPPRKDKLEKLNLLVSVKSKRRAYQIATDRDISVGRLFETLVSKARLAA